MNASKESVLAAALEIFPRLGYHDAKISDICDAAGANISAVNYYFQSKDHLYLEIWKLLWQDYAQRFTKIMSNPSWNSRTKLERILQMNIKDSLSDDDTSRLSRLSFFEKSAPSPVFETINITYFQGMREQIIGLLRDFFGDKCDDKTMKVAGLCVREPIYGIINLKIRGVRAIDAEMIEKGYMTDFMDLFDDVDALVAAVMKYIFGGLDALRK